MKKMAKDCLDVFVARNPLLVSLLPQINMAFEVLVTAGSHNNLVLACGNGGSAADAEHIVGELMNKFGFSRPIPKEHEDLLRNANADNAHYLIQKLNRTVKAICLTSQSALVSAIANDVAADMIFAQQVYGYGGAGDILIAISTSGNSPNVVNAAIVAKAMGMHVIALTGEGGGELLKIATVTLRAPTSCTWQVQEYHLPIYHVLCAMVEIELFGN